MSDNPETEYKKIKEQILLDKSVTFDQCVESYLKVYGYSPTYSSHFQTFISILADMSLYNELVIDKLRHQISLGDYQSNLDQYIKEKEIELTNKITVSEWKFIPFIEEIEIIEEIEKNERPFTNEKVDVLSPEERKLVLRDEYRKEFSQSDVYKYVKQFARKYGEKWRLEDFSQLQLLLSKWQWEFSLDELKTFVLEEVKRENLENLKSKILMDKPHNRGAILKFYLNFYRSSDNRNLKTLAELLEERYSSSESIIELKNELEVIEKRIELENFARRLGEEDKQIYLDDIDQLNGYAFEDFLKNLFSKIGYEVQQTRLSGDQGADLVVVKFGEKKVIQAKRFGGKVGNKAVQEIMAAISLYRAQKGMVITNNYFTPAAVELANANKIELIDRDALEELINKHW